MTPKQLEKLSPKDRELIEAYNTLTNRAEGILVLNDILNYCALMVSGAETTEQLWFREGQKNVATYVIGRLQQGDHRNYADLLMAHAEGVYEDELHRETVEE